MEYRLAKLEDAKDIYEIVQDTIKRIYPKYYLPEIVDMFCKFHSKGNIAADIENGNTYILLENNKAIGTGTMKENHILRRYGYHDFGIQLTKILLILLFVGIVQLSGLTWVCEWLNQMAKVLGIADIVSYNIFNYL